MLTIFAPVLYPSPLSLSSSHIPSHRFNSYHIIRFESIYKTPFSLEDILLSPNLSLSVPSLSIQCPAVPPFPFRSFLFLSFPFHTWDIGRKQRQKKTKLLIHDLLKEHLREREETAVYTLPELAIFPCVSSQTIPCHSIPSSPVTPAT